MSESYENNGMPVDDGQPAAPGMGPSPDPMPRPEPSPAPEAAPQAPRRVRRVGTLTMGVALILTGVAIGVSLIWPSFDLTLIFRLCPLILVVLGCEVLVSSFAKGDVKLKYDFLSMLVCFVLIVASLGVSLVPYALRYWGPDRDLVESRVERQLEEEVYRLLKDDAAVSDCAANVYFEGYEFDKNATLETLDKGDHVGIRIDLRGPYDNVRTFAEDCARVRDKLLAGGLEPSALNFEWNVSTDDYYAHANLHLSGAFQMKEDPENLAARVDSQLEIYGNEEQEGYHGSLREGFPTAPEAPSAPAAPQAPSAPEAPSAPTVPDAA